MKNPWLGIPLSEYEAHMTLPHVAQAPLLADVFARALAEFHPRSVAVLGCAGGNGFDRVAGSGVERVVGVDINPEYIAQARVRFESTVPGLELFAGDIQADAFAFDPVDLVFAGLLFEYVDVPVVMGRISGMLRPGGVLVSVVQLPSDTTPEVTPSPYASLAALAPVMRLVPPGALLAAAHAHGLAERESRTLDASPGKRLHVQVFVQGRAA